MPPSEESPIAFLRALDGTDAHGRAEIPLGASLTVGRHPANGLVLAHDDASRHHARIERVGDGWGLSDLASRNGTTVDGRPALGLVPLEPGARLRFGGGPTWEFALATPIPEPPATHPGPGLWLCEEDGPRRVRCGRVLTLGRDPGNGLVLDHERVSGHHAVIEQRGGRWFLRDLGSRNGTTVAGRRVRGWRLLREGTRILFGGGSAWRVQEVVAPGPGATAAPDRTLADDSAASVVLTLTWEGEDGLVRVEQQGARWEEPAGQVFLLLWELAGTPGVWVDDGALRSALWGAAANQLTRTALNTTVYQARRLFAAHGLPAGLVEKDPTRRGRTRLRLPPERVRRRRA